MITKKFTMTLKAVHAAIMNEADEDRARNLQRFFKTGPGDYGEGDRFVGIKVPTLRRLAKTFKALPLEKTERLLASKIHEERLLALFILTHHFQQADDEHQKTIVDCYLRNTARINNWDLVDISAGHILGAWLFKRRKTLLTELAQSRSLWERRIAIIATGYFIAQGEFKPTLKIAKLLLNDEHDLIHKAVGWMLREVGKRDQTIEEAFLRKYYRDMPRTLLRYAIERFPEGKRQAYLQGRID